METCGMCNRELVKGEEDICEHCELANDEQMVNDRERES